MGFGQPVRKQLIPARGQRKRASSASLLIENLLIYRRRRARPRKDNGGGSRRDLNHAPPVGRDRAEHPRRDEIGLGKVDIQRSPAINTQRGLTGNHLLDLWQYFEGVTQLVASVLVRCAHRAALNSSTSSRSSRAELANALCLDDLTAKLPYDSTECIWSMKVANMPRSIHSGYIGIVRSCSVVLCTALHDEVPCSINNKRRAGVRR